MAQTDIILDVLKMGITITQRDAIYMGCYRLAAVIFKLKKAGHHIKTEMVEVTKADGNTTRIAAYSLIKEEAADEQN